MKEETLIFSCPPAPAMIACGTFRFAPGEGHSNRIWPSFVLILVVRGEFWLTEDGREYVIREQEYFIETPGLHHYGTRGCQQETFYYWFHFMPTAAWQMVSGSGSAGVTVENHGDFRFLPVWQGGLPAHGWFDLSIEPELRQMTGDFAEGKQLLGLQGRFLEILSGLMEGRPGEKPPPHVTVAEKTRSCLVARATEDLHMKQVAESLYFTVDYMTRCFRRCYGMTPAVFLCQLRMNMARNLLTGTDLTIRKTGEAVGYPDPVVFSRTFRRVCGMSPVDYRAQSSPSGVK